MIPSLKLSGGSESEVVLFGQWVNMKFCVKFSGLTKVDLNI